MSPTLLTVAAAAALRPGPRSPSAIAVLMVAMGSLPAGVAVAHAQTDPVDTLALRGYTFFLSHDRLEGRGTASTGARIAALYVASVCQTLGLRPLGTSYFQTVALERALILPETSLRIESPNARLLVHHPEVVPYIGDAASLVGFHGPALYIGPSERVEQGLPVDLDIHGAVAVTLGTVSAAGARVLRRRGAVGLIQLIPDSVAFHKLRERLGDDRLYHADPTVASSYLLRLPSVVGGPAATRALLQRRGRLALNQRFEADVAVRIAQERTRLEDHNVLCLLEGTGDPAADSLIILAAHYDHLGVGPADAAGDSIYNGFSDNAAGVGMLLALARAFRREAATPFRHAVLFLFLTGEERGLLGSDYYVSRPPWPLDRTTAVITLDAGAPPAPPTTWELAGGDSTSLGTLAVRVAQRQGWSATTSPLRPISDFYPFARRGVPSLLIIPGPGPYEGLSADSSAALRRRWDHYHHPADEWSAVFPLGGLRRYAQYAALIARAIDGTGLAGTR